MVPPVAPAGADGAEDAMTALLRQLVLNDTRRAGNNRPKAINSRTFTCGQDFPNFITHFRQCVKAAYNFTLPADEAALNQACITWLPTKLEPGPTLITYESLTAAKKADWNQTVEALTDAFEDESEKEIFLADQASFKRGDKSLVQYKNELMRLMQTYLPDLVGVPEEFQRQACTRFIEGLDNDELKRLLRRNCRRTKNTLEEAYLFTVDYESSDLQTKIREGEAATLGKKSLAAATAPAAVSSDIRPKILRRPATVTSRFPSNDALGAVDEPLAEEVRGLAAKHKITEMRVQELTAKSAHTNDRIDILAKEVSQVAVNTAKLDNKLDRMNASIASMHQMMISNNQQSQTNQNQSQNSFRQFNQNGQRGQFQNANRGNRGTHPVQSSQGGGGNFARNGAQTGQFRNNSQGFNRQTSNLTSQATPAAVNAQKPPPTDAAAVVAPVSLSAIEDAGHDDEETAPKRETGWWSPGMLHHDIPGYEEEGGNLSYGGEDFYRQ